MKIRFRYSLRTLLVAIVGFALLLAAFSPTYRWLKWRAERQSLHQWAATLKREPKHCESKSIQLSDGRWLGVYTAEVKFPSDFSRATYAGQPVRDYGFFVVPPGKWVESLEDVLRLWDEYD